MEVRFSVRAHRDFHTAGPTIFVSLLLQVWKTHMGRNRGQTTLGSLRAIYREGGGGFRGVSAF